MPCLPSTAITRLDRLWELLPTLASSPALDAENGDRLRALLEIIGRTAGAVEDDIGHFRDWFIETCAEWAIPLSRTWSG